MGLAVLWILALMVALPRLTEKPARIIAGGSLALANVLALVAGSTFILTFPLL